MKKIVLIISLLTPCVAFAGSAFNAGGGGGSSFSGQGNSGAFTDSTGILTTNTTDFYFDSGLRRLKIGYFNPSADTNSFGFRGGTFVFGDTTTAAAPTMTIESGKSSGLIGSYRFNGLSGSFNTTMGLINGNMLDANNGSFTFQTRNNGSTVTDLTISSNGIVAAIATSGTTATFSTVTANNYMTSPIGSFTDVADANVGNNFIPKKSAGSGYFVSSSLQEDPATTHMGINASPSGSAEFTIGGDLQVNGNIITPTSIQWPDGTVQVSSPQASSSSGGGGGYVLEPATVTIQANKGIIGSTYTATSTTTLTYVLVSSGADIKGSTSGLSATAGNYSEEISTVIPEARAKLFNNGSGNWIDVSTITLTAGDWMCYAFCDLVKNGANLAGSPSCAFSAQSGASLTDIDFGDNANSSASLPLIDEGIVVEAQHVTPSATKNYYLKANLAWISGTPQAAGTIRCIRNAH